MPERFDASKAKRIHLIYNGLGAGNVGDEAMFAGFIQMLPKAMEVSAEVADDAFRFHSSGASRIRFVCHEDAEACRQLISMADAVLLVGDTPIMDGWGLDWPMRYHERRLTIPLEMNKPVHAIGVGVDRLDTEEGRRIFSTCHSRIASWTVRSHRCRAALIKLGVDPARVLVGADLAWLFAKPVSTLVDPASVLKAIGIDPSRPIMGVNVVNEVWSKEKNVKIELAAGLDHVARNTGMQILFMCNETRNGEYFDFEASRDIAALLETDSSILPNQYRTPAEMIAFISCCAVTLSQRFHFSLFSVLAGVPTVMFERGQKMAVLMEELGDVSVGSMTSCSRTLVENRLTEILEERENVIQRQSAAGKILAGRALGNFTFLFEDGGQEGSVVPVVALASKSEMHSDPFRFFMETVNGFARSLGLREFTDWSKIWEYPWLWFNGLAGLWRNGGKLLDIGSELSPMPWLAASLGMSVTLVESDDQWLPDWVRIKDSTGLDVSWEIVGDEKLPLPDGSFDVVTSFSVIEHQARKDVAIDEIARVLIPGGRLALSFDICEPDLGMTFPEWNGNAITMVEFERLIWQHPAFEMGSRNPEWNVDDIPEFLSWHRTTAPHHNYAVGAAVLRKRTG